MTKTIDVTKARTAYLDLISDVKAREIIHKGWSLSFAYSFQEIRDVFLAFRKFGQKDITIAEFSKQYVKDKIPYQKSPWDESGRRVLEVKNALINFGLMESGSLICKKGCFEDVEPGSPISEADRQVFKDIFFNYFRFLEYASLFITPDMGIDEKLKLTEQQIIRESGVVFYYGSKGGRVDSFFYTLNRPEVIYLFPVSEKTGMIKGGFQRFWDVFLSWGKELELIERLNMQRQGFILSNGGSFRACYFVNTDSKVDVQDIIDKSFPRQLLVDISNLVMEICMKYRCSINSAQHAVINYYQEQPERVTLIRTSEIFIKETELNKNDRVLYPKYKGSFVSHIKIRSHE